jgi:hypothetical protein
MQHCDIIEIDDAQRGAERCDFSGIEVPIEGTNEVGFAGNRRP